MSCLLCKCITVMLIMQKRLMSHVSSGVTKSHMLWASCCRSCGTRIAIGLNDFLTTRCIRSWLQVTAVSPKTNTTAAVRLGAFTQGHTQVGLR